MLIDLVFENTRIFGLLDPTNNFGHLMLVAPGWNQGICSHPSLNQPLSGDKQMNMEFWDHHHGIHCHPDHVSHLCQTILGSASLHLPVSLPRHRRSPSADALGST